LTSSIRASTGQRRCIPAQGPASTVSLRTDDLLAGERACRERQE
jgi:hypothetical protein